jgi:23S rRNA (uracil1939-C5)-methyltransferase
MAVQIGKIYSISIESLTHNAEGVGRVDGFTVFVPEAIPGDTVEVKVISKKKTYARALITGITKASKDRVEPFCRYYSECGGCQLQHLDYKKQLLYKSQLVKEAFSRIAGIDVCVAPTIGMENPHNYRNKSSLPISGEQGKIEMGFYKKRSHDVISIEECPIQLMSINEVMKISKRLINELEIAPYCEHDHSGDLRHFVVRVAPNTGEVLLSLVSKNFNNKFNEFAVMIADLVPSIKGVILNVNDKKSNAIFGSENHLLCGNSSIVDEMLGLKFNISATSFYQINGEQTNKLYKTAIDKINFKCNEVVIDAYSGTGTIGMIMSSAAKKVIGIEVVKAAVTDAVKSSGINRIDNISFIQGKVENVIGNMTEIMDSSTVLVVDPPRKGCDIEFINAVGKSNITKLLYISCNPSTLARDVKLLLKFGFMVKDSVQPVDMFPHTSHVETVCLLTRK